MTVSFLISLAVGTAAALSTIDDVARRELIGLAATSQVAIIPVWLGVCAIFGFPETTTRDEIVRHYLSLVINIATIVVTSLAVYIIAYGLRPSLVSIVTRGGVDKAMKSFFSKRANSE